MTKGLRASLNFYLLLYMSTCLSSMNIFTAENHVRSSRPEFLFYDELVPLSLDKPLPPDLSAKLNAITNTPFINNEAYYGSARLRPLETTAPGPSLRVALWNIERGMQLDNLKVLIKDKDRFMAEGAREREKRIKKGKSKVMLI
jgi:hypothetical protein